MPRADEPENLGDHETAVPACPAEDAGEPWRWCPRCGHELENQKCKLRCPRCHYFMSCSDFDMAR